MIRTMFCAVLILGTLVAGRALADPSTTVLDLLHDEVVERHDALVGDLPKALAKEKKGLAKALAIYGKDAFSVLDDLKTYGKMHKVLHKLYPEDAEMQYLLGDALTTFSSLIDQDLTQAQLTVASLPDSPAKAKAQKLLDKALAAMAQAGIEPDRAKASKSLAKAEKLRLKALLAAGL